MERTKKSKIVVLLTALSVLFLTAILLTACCGKKDPEYQVPENLTATYGDKLHEIELPEGFTWESDENTLVGNVGENTFTVTFTPEDTENYNIISGIEVTVTVEKATLPEINLTAKINDKLVAVDLPENYEWKDPVSTSVGALGENTFEAKYVGDDKDNYTNADNVVVNITVVKKSLSEYSKLEFSGDVGQTVSDIKINESKYIYGTGTWDVDDENYNKPLEYGLNIRYASFTGSDTYDGAEHYPVKVYATTVNVSTLEELESAILNEKVDNKTSTVNVVEDITITKDLEATDAIKLNVAEGKTLTISEGASLTLKQRLTSVDGKILNGVGYGNLVYEAGSSSNLRNAVQNDMFDKIVLTQDISVSSTSGKWSFSHDISQLVVDLNGFDITGSIELNNSKNCSVNIKLTNSSSEESKVVSESGYGVFVSGGSNTYQVGLENITFEGSSFGLTTNGTQTGATVVANNCKFIASGIGAYLPANYTINFKNCEFSGKTAVYIKDGDVSFDDCTLTGTMEYAEPSYNNNGANPTGSALVVDSSKGYATEEFTVKVENSTLNSTHGYGVEECTTSDEGQNTDYATIELKDNTYNATKGDTSLLQA